MEGNTSRESGDNAAVLGNCDGEGHGDTDRGGDVDEAADEVLDFHKGNIFKV